MSPDHRDGLVRKQDKRSQRRVCCPKSRYDEASGMVSGGLLIGCCSVQHFQA